MSRYAAMFERLGSEGAFGAFLMLGDPDLDTSARLLDAVEAGADSLLIADVPAIEGERFTREMAQAGIEPVLIAAANTPDPALRRIASLSKAYTYCVSRAGITGTHASGEFDAQLIERVKRAGAPPPIFGFGISRPEHVRAAIAAGARGVICGSAIVDLAARGGDVAAFVRTLKDSTRNESPPQ
jgi:tryptophan synthase alpha chain